MARPQNTIVRAGSLVPGNVISYMGNVVQIKRIVVSYAVWAKVEGSTYNGLLRFEEYQSVRLWVKEHTQSTQDLINAVEMLYAK